MYPHNAFIFFCFFGSFTAAIHNSGDVSINCGGVGTSAARNGREWIGDANSKFTHLLRIKDSSIISSVNRRLSSGDYPVPYGTARISKWRFSYEFQVNPGEKIVRLHFNSAPYKGFRGLKDLFAVESGPYTLLSNFSASLAADALGVNSFVKEFCIYIEETQLLNLIFSPASTELLDTYAFINGIEIISVSSSRSYFHVENVGVQMVGKSSVNVGYNTAFEIISRLNFRDDSVFPIVNNFSYVFGIKANKMSKGELTPKTGHTNVTWRVSVGVGFRYMVRLYFSGRAETGDFKICINEMVDIVKERDGEENDAWHRDFMVTMNGCKQEGRRDILIYLETSREFMNGHGPLQGFEVLKLSNPDNSLAPPNPLPSARNLSYHTVKNLLQVLARKYVLTFSAIAMLSLANIVIYISQKMQEDGGIEKENMPSARDEPLCHRFTLAEIHLATRNFSEANFIGKGGFGNVYKGLIYNGKQTVAVKRLKSNSGQGAREFLTEIETLTELRHVNLVCLIGYCSERREMILVYEYMGGGTLADHLHELAQDSEKHSPLTWKQRLNICIGAGRGLDYLHTGRSLIHRDFKAANILLDNDFVPKVSDFGLAKYLSKEKLDSHVSTNVKGTPGYIDPNYLYTGRLTTKSDVYAFGVVLLEVLTGRPAANSRVRDEKILAKWAREKISQGKADKIVASNLRGQVSAESLKAFVDVAERCLHEEPRKRPTMAKVVLQLQFALGQQETTKFPWNDNLWQPETTKFPLKDNLSLKGKPNRKGVMPLPGRNEWWETPSRYTRSRFWSSDAVPKRPQRSEAFKIVVFSAFIQVGDMVFLEKEVGLTSPEMMIRKGQAAEVYKAVLPASGEEITIKKISRSPPSKMGDIQFLVNTICLIKHRNILSLLAHRWQPDCHYLIYKYMKNGNLRDCLQHVADGRTELDWVARYKIALGVAAGLEHLHHNHRPCICHRDLKPTNILLDDEMEARISGLEAAVAVPDDHTPATAQHVIGAIGYIAPEYVHTSKFSNKCDVYSFGMILGVLVTGKQPLDEFFEDVDISMVKWMRKAMCSKDPERALDPKLLGDGYEEQMIRVLEVACMCSQDDPEKRPNSEEVRRSLSKVNPLVFHRESKPISFSSRSLAI